MVRAAALILALLLAFPAAAQVNQPVYQGPNPVTRGHLGSWLDQGVLGDAGGTMSGNVTELGITNLGLPFCVNDAPTSSANGYRQLCLGADATVLGSEGGFITYNAFGGATPRPLYLNINGANYTLPPPNSGQQPDFGIPVDGVSDATASLTAALTWVCSAGVGAFNTLVLPRVTLQVSSPIVISPCNNAVIEGNGVTIHCSIGGSDTCITFQGNISAAVPVVSASGGCPGAAGGIAAGDTTIALCGVPANTTVGSVVRVASGDYWFATSNTIGYQIKVAAVQAPGATPGSISLQEAFPFALTSGAAPTVQLITPGTNVTIRNLTILGGFIGGGGDQQGMSLHYIDNFAIENVSIRGFDDDDFLFDGVWGGHISNSEGSFALGTGLGYGFVVYNGSRDVSFDGIRCYRNWDCVAAGGFSDINRNIIISGASAVSMLKTCFNEHEGGLDYSIANSTCIAAADALHSNHSFATFNGAGKMTLINNHYYGNSSSAFIFQPVVTYPILSSATAIGNSVECVAPAAPPNTVVGFEFQSHNAGNLGMTIVDHGNHTSGCDYAHFVISLTGSAPIKGVTVTGNIDDTAPNFRSLYVQQQPGGGVISNIVESGNAFLIANNYESVYFQANDPAGIINVAAGPDSIVQDTGSGGIYNRFINVDRAKVHVGSWVGASSSSPLLSSGTTNLSMDGTLQISPTVGGGFGVGATLTDTNGTSDFTITINASPSLVGQIDFPNSPLGQGWHCDANDVTTANATVFVQRQVGGTIATCLIANYNSSGAQALMNIGDTIQVHATPY